MQALKSWHHRRKLSVAPADDIPTAQGSVFGTTLISRGFFVEKDRVSCAILLQNGQSILYGSRNGVYFQRLCGDLTGAPIKVLDLKRVDHLGILTQAELLVVSTNTSVLLFACTPRAGFSAITLDQGVEIARGKTIVRTGSCLGGEVVCIVRSQRLSSTIKLFRPIPGDTAAPKTRSVVFKDGHGPRLRLFKEFYLSSQCHDVYFLKNKLMLACANEFQVVDPKTLNTQALLDPTDTSFAFLAPYRGLRPIAFYRVEERFLVCYNHCAFYVDKSGWRTEGDPVMEWGSVSSSFAFAFPHLMVCLSNHVQIRDVRNGKTVQVVPGPHFCRLFEGTEPWDEPTREDKPIVMKSESQIVLFQRSVS